MATSPLHAQSQSDGYKFLEAVKKRNGDEVTRFLEEPGSILVNSRDISSGDTALHIVTQRRDPVWLRFLLAKGANPNMANNWISSYLGEEEWYWAVLEQPRMQQIQPQHFLIKNMEKT